VTDFGIARVAAGAELTDEGSIVGTAQYMSPEQGASSQVDGRSDLYALGVVAHLALAGRLPFEGESAASLLAMHLARPAPSLLERAPAVPRRIADAVDRCLAKQPTDRWATGEAFADALDAATPARREVPAPLRVWLSRGMALRPLYLIWSTPLTMIVATHLLATHEPFARQAVLLAAPWVFHALLRAQETRRVLGEGFTLPDLRLALDLDADRQREERRAENAAGPSPFGRLVRVVAYLGLATAAGVAAALSVGGRLVETVSVVTLLQIFAVASTVAIGGALLGLGLPGRRLEKESVLTRLRRQFWKSRLGQWYVAALEPARSRPRALAGALQRPTELAIGLAVDDLYDALPKRAREEARTLPALARRLEGEAQAMRARVAELDERIGEAERGAAAPLVVGSWDAGRADALAAQRSTLVADLRAAREGAGRRLALAVAALESLRLDLLRLHAGAGDLGSLTATLAAAERVGAEIDAMMGGHAMPRDDASSREPTRA
jgi:serine/threonine-protein kinase